MPRKRIKSKLKRITNYNNLTDELYQAICKKVSMYELLGDYKQLGYKHGNYFVMFDKTDSKVCKQLWDLHKNEVMEKWKNEPYTAGTRPFLWWIVEAPEPRIKGTRVKKYSIDKNSNITYWPGGELERVYEELEPEREYLTRLNLLEPWEIAEFSRHEKDKPFPVEE